MRLRTVQLAAFAALIGAALVPFARAGPLIGSASTVVKDVKGRTEAELRVLIVNDDVFQDEEISTGTQSATKMLFKDNTTLTMGEGSKLKLSKVVFDPDPSKSTVALRATQGAFRMSTGRLPSAAYRIDTPVATIGVRGTVIEFSVGGDGATTLYVASGAAVVSVERPGGVEQVFVPLGQATVVALGADGLPMAPSPPAAPSGAFVEQMRNMTMLVQLAGTLNDIAPGAGSAGGPGLVAVQVTLTGDSAAAGGAARAFGASAPGPSLASFDLVRTNFSSPTVFPTLGPPPPALPPSFGPAFSAPPPPSIQPVVATAPIPQGGGGPIVIVPGPPVTSLQAPPPKPTRINPNAAVPITVTGNGAVSGSCSGAGAISLPAQGGSVTVTCTVAVTNHGLQTVGVPFNLTNPQADGTLLFDVIGVGPELATDLNGGIDFLAVALGDSESFHFFIKNQTGDEGTPDLVGLSILGLQLYGDDAQYYTVVCVLDGQVQADCHPVLMPGDILNVILTFHAPQQGGVYDQAWLRILTDQFAAFGAAGLQFDVALRGEAVGVTVAIAEPAGLGLMGLAGAYAWLVARRRRR